MAKKLEKQTQKEVILYLKSKGYIIVKTIVSNARGISDLLICADGKFVAIEMKAEGKRNNTSALQRRFIDEVKEAGGIAFVAESVQDVKAKGL